MVQSIRQRFRHYRGMKTEKVSVSLPFGLGGLELAPNKAEQRAAWSLYVELTTRIAVQPFNPETGLMREVLASLYSLFSLTRQVLREAGPDVAQGPNSLGPLAIEILTKGLAPFTTRWHQKLGVYELSCPPGVSALEHEHSWEHFDQMRQELEELQGGMRKYAVALAEIAGTRRTNEEGDDE
jgi:hypothetical protein